MENKLELINITKEYGKLKALDCVNYSFTKGLYGIIGANGAGKSTLMDIITTSLNPTSGSVLYNGENIFKSREYKNKIAYVPQQQKIFEEFTGRQFLGYFAALKGVKGHGVKKLIEKVLAEVNLTEAADKRIRGYSGGMKQRILIAQALLAEFDILILDESTVGLDPEERMRFRNLVMGFAREKIVIFTTHILSDVEKMADKIVYMKKGVLSELDGSFDNLEGVFTGN